MEGVNGVLLTVVNTAEPLVIVPSVANVVVVATHWNVEALDIQAGTQDDVVF
jgi:hypothetical protein